MKDFIFRRTPYKHQLDIFHVSRDREFYALLMEMGTGKTFITLNNAAWLYAQGKIDGLLVISPNGLTRMWCEQCSEHMPDYIDYKATWYVSQPTKKEEVEICNVLNHTGLKIVAMNIEAFATAKGVAFAKKFLLSFRSMMVIDESSTIKSPKAIRTKNLLKLSVHAKYRRILTGTPVTQGPLDLFTQFSFLDSHILRCQSYYAFRNKYAILQSIQLPGRPRFDKITGYHNVEELTKLIEPHSYRVTKSDCLDLPEKLYSKRYVELSTLQAKLYQTLKKEVVAEFNGKEMTAPLALMKLLRLQQIVGGFFVPDIDVTENEQTFSVKPEPIDKVNPRVESLIELLEETDGKVIIWARFRAEIGAIVHRLEDTFGKNSYIEYHGGVDNLQRSEGIQKFQTVDSCRFFVGHVQAGGKGLTLHAASTVVYFSNDFSLENRLQSEDRAHRIGQKNNVTYIDFVAPGTLDEKVVKTLRDKKSVADLITGDIPMEEWI